jgi:phosphoglycerate dehydrogenase-like enzyme
MPNILIMPTPLRHRPGRFRTILGQAGFTPIDPPGTARLTDADLDAALPRADALLAWGAPITATMISRAPRLRAIARAGSGIEAVDLAAASARQVVVSNTPGANAESVAEHTFALLLALTRHVVDNDRSVRDGAWDRRPSRPLRGSTLGIVGLGRIGLAVARRALGFGMHVVAASRPGAGPVSERAEGAAVPRCELDDLLARADVVSLHLRLSAETRGLFDHRAFARMRPGALFLNTARGGLVVERDLAAGLASGHLGGAGLDVQESEPPARENLLLSLPNVVFSPHVGAVDTEALDRMAERAAECVVSLYRGGWPEGCVVNPELRPSWRW